MAYRARRRRIVWCGARSSPQRRPQHALTVPRQEADSTGLSRQVTGGAVGSDRKEPFGQGRKESEVPTISCPHPNLMCPHFVASLLAQRLSRASRCRVSASIQSPWTTPPHPRRHSLHTITYCLLSSLKRTRHTEEDTTLWHANAL